MTRTLIYAMQSSGASAYAFKLGKDAAQREIVLCIPDLWNPHRAPAFNDVSADHIILKVVVTNKFTLDQHIASFNPTTVLLFQRNRQDNIRSLSCKSYAYEAGDMAFKFSLFDTEVSRNRFPVLHYENMPWLQITRSDATTMLLNNSQLSEWAANEFQKSWGFGGIRNTCNSASTQLS